MLTRNLNNNKTSMQVYWADKDELTKFKKIKKRWENEIAVHYESDKELMSRITKILVDLHKAKSIKDNNQKFVALLEILKDLEKDDDPKSTYPYGMKEAD